MYGYEYLYMNALESRILNLEKQLGIKSETAPRFTEFSYSKHNFKDKVADHIREIAQCWCVCMYIKQNSSEDLRNEYFKHRRELENLLESLNKVKLCRTVSRRKTAYETIVNDLQMHDLSVVYSYCRVRFLHLCEDLGANISKMTIDHQRRMCELFSEKIVEIVNCIASDDITAYTRSEFPDNIME